jgi:hypothetical protein
VALPVEGRNRVSHRNYVHYERKLSTKQQSGLASSCGGNNAKNWQIERMAPCSGVATGGLGEFPHPHFYPKFFPKYANQLSNY